MRDYRINTSDKKEENRIVEGTDPILCDSCAKNFGKVYRATYDDKVQAVELDEIIKPGRIKFTKINPKKCSIPKNFKKDFQAEERVFEIVTNDRKIEKLVPMRLKDPDRMLAFLETYIGIKKRSMGWFPTRPTRTEIFQ